MNTLIAVILILLLIGVSPTLGVVSIGWGPSGLVGVLLIVLLVMALTGKL